MEKETTIIYSEETMNIIDNFCLFDDTFMHDFNWQKSEDLYYDSLRKGFHHFKETEEGRKDMCQLVEDYAQKRAQELLEEYAEKRAEEKLIVNINSLMESMKWSVEQAMDALKLSNSEGELVLKKM